MTLLFEMPNWLTERAAARQADIAVKDGKISEIGAIDAKTTTEIDAKGDLVTPGWVDIHTHYDGQVTWDPYLSPSGWNGVTTAVMGNCGVGFAPSKTDKHRLAHQSDGRR